jgi:hypothetical protein
MESDSDGRWGVEDLSVFQKVRTLFAFVLPICGRKRRRADGQSAMLSESRPFFFCSITLLKVVVVTWDLFTCWYGKQPRSDMLKLEC